MKLKGDEGFSYFENWTDKPSEQYNKLLPDEIQEKLMKNDWSLQVSTQLNK